MTQPQSDSETQRFSLKIALAALAMVLFAILLTMVVSADFSFRSIDQGWATLIAGLLGFGAIAFQTNKGFENLRRSAVEQAEANRDAREHQAELQRRLELERELRNRKGLAGALAAELIVLAKQVRNRLPFLRVQQEFYKKIVGSGKANIPDMSLQLPSFEAHFYRQNIGELALLGPSTAHDVVDLYTTVLTKPQGATDTLTGEQVALIFEGWEKVYDNWLSEQDFLLKRLLAIVGDRPDPGALFDFRSAKIKKASEDGATG